MLLSDIMEELERIEDGECCCERQGFDLCLACTAGGILNESAQILREGHKLVMNRSKEMNRKIKLPK